MGLCDWTTSSGEPLALFAVLDGHGGHAVSILASRLLVKQLRLRVEACERSWSSLSTDERRELLERAFLDIDGELAKKAAAVDCGSTCIAAILWRSAADPSGAVQVLMANVGDSRGLIVRRDSAEVLLET